MEKRFIQVDSDDKAMTQIKVLLVDDEHEKTVAISTLLNSLQLGIHVEHRSDAASARSLLQSEQFHLLLIDLNLPDSLHSAPSVDAGFALFDLLCLDSQVRLPSNILFVTAKDEGLSVARSKANERGVSLCFVQSVSDAWKSFLSGRLRLIAKQIIGTDSPEVEVVVVTAMRDPELKAVLNLPCGWSQRRLPGDPSTYHFGTLAAGKKVVRVAAVAAQGKGMAASAAVAAKAAVKLRPKYLVMLGICAGVRSKTNIGDVVIGSPTWDWGSGKHAQDESGSVVFRTGALQSSLEATVLEIARDVGEDKTIRTGIRAGWSGPVPAGEFSVHSGPMATGASVLAHSDMMEFISDQNRDVLAVEMEAYAVMAAAESCSCKGLVIKSVCDFADATKSDDWQAYASYTSAAFFFHLVPKLTL